jgi:anaerobic ribonucleoside-triphosphate reductase
MRKIEMRKVSIDLEMPDVRVSKWEIIPYSIDKIVDSLFKETGMVKSLARKVANEATIRLHDSKHKTLSAPLIREVCCEIMIEMGLGEYRGSYTRVGLPVKDVERIIMEGIKENANQNFNPESTHLWTADKLKQEYYLVDVIPRYQKIFNIKCPSLADAHLRGDIYAHKLRFFMDRPFCEGWDARCILLNGLPPGGSPHFANARPAKHADVAFLHLAKHYGIVQGLFSGGQGYDNFCVFLAPYIRGILNEKDTEQLAQKFLFETGQIYASRAQTPFTSIDTEPGVPKDLQDVLAVLPGGKVDGSVYGDYEDEVERLFLAFNKAYRKGDGNGRLFNFPKHEIKTRKEMWNKHQDAYYDAHVTTAKMGDGYYLTSNEKCHSQCLPYNEQLMTRINGKIYNKKIGDLITEEMDNLNIIKKGNAPIWFSPNRKVEVLSLNPENKRIEWNLVTNMLFNPQESKIIKITTEDGLQGHTNENHPFIVLDHDKQELVLKKADNIQVGDYILKMSNWDTKEEIPIQFDLIKFIHSNKNIEYDVNVYGFDESILNSSVRKELKIPIRKNRNNKENIRPYLHFDEYIQLENNTLDRKNIKLVPKGGKGFINAIITYNKDLMTFLGWYLAEGSKSKKRGIRLSFGSYERDYIEESKDIVKKVFNLNTKERIQINPEKNRNHCNVEVNSYIILDLLDHWNVGDNSHSKRIPDFVFQLPNKLTKYLIRSLFLGDGYSRISGKKIEVTLHITSEQLIRDVHYLLLQHKINSTIKRRDKSVVLYIEQGMSIKKFLEMIPEWKKKYELNPPPEKEREYPTRSERYPASLIYPTFIKNATDKKMVYNARRINGRIGLNIINRIPKESISKFLKNLLISKDISLTKIINKEYCNTSNDFYDIEVGGLGRNGNFVHSDGIITHNCCRLIMHQGDYKKFCLDTDKFDWHKSYLNIGSLHPVSINLPRIAYQANGDDDKFFEILDERIWQCMELLLMKRKLFIKRFNSTKTLLNNKVKFPRDSELQPLYDLSKQSLTLGFVGGNEMCLAHTGHELHEGNGAVLFMKKVLNYMKDKCEEYSVLNQCMISLWEQPAESCAGRYAKLDMKMYPDKCVCQGKDSKSYYYTNSSHIRYGADIPLSKIIKIQAQFHPITRGGVITHVWLGESISDPEALMKMTEKIMTTPTYYFAYTFDFSQCMNCNKFVKGRIDRCQTCGSIEIEWWSRVTGYYSRVKRYLPAKYQEWKDRFRHNKLDMNIQPKTNHWSGNLKLNL